ncbi:hypothetical protein [Teichococcus aestuarii]|uniref:hypothetical protein n=2 Tax=Teichococcus aestuarii TaxID=568898 RepID=UPI003614CE13
MNAALRWDPRTFLAAFALWSILFSIGCFSTTRMFDIQPVFRVLRDVGLRESFWGAVTLIDGLLLMLTLWMGSINTRAAVACLSAGLWAFVGGTMVWSGSLQGFFSPAGAFSILGSAGCVAATIQWANWGR